MKLHTNVRTTPRAERGRPDHFDGFDKGPRVGVEWRIAAKQVGVIVFWSLLIGTFVVLMFCIGK